MRIIAKAAFILCLLGAVTVARATPVYKVTILDSLERREWEQAIGLNDLGQTAGYSATLFDQGHATLWQPDGSVKGIITSDGFAMSRSVNNKGQVVGWIDNPDNSADAFYWDEATGITLIEPDDGVEYLQAYDINNSGFVVGRAYDGATFSSFIWNKENGYRNLETPEEFASARAFRINDQGQVLGSLWKDGRQYMYIWSEADGFQIIDPAVTSLFTLGFNELGDIAGFGKFNDGSNYNKPFYSTAENGIAHLSLSEYESGMALDVNDLGQIVGSVSDYDDQQNILGSYGAYWENDIFFNLNDLIDRDTPDLTQVVITGTHRINEYGQIAAYGYFADSGLKSAFLLSQSDLHKAIPAPAWGGIYIFVGLGVMLRQRKRKVT